MAEEAEVEFPWDRHWVRSGATLRLDLDGYIVDPVTSGKFVAVNPDERIVRRLNDLSEFLLVGLEGEVGIGKSRMAQRSVLELEAAGQRARYVDAAELETVAPLTEMIEDSPATTFFIDAIDAFDSAPKLTKVVSAAVEHKVHVRFVCRTAAWPERLRTAIEQAGGAFFEALPLTRREIVAAAEAVGVEPGDFLKAISSRAGQPLAMKPLTLVALLAAFKNGRLPSSKRELYTQECERHCREANPSQRDLEARQELTTPEQRLRLIERAAALSVFCDLPLIRSRGERPGESTSRQLPVEDIVMGADETFGATVERMTPAMFRDATRKCGLITGGEGATLTFGHRGYAEFLAAKYLYDRGTPLAQIRSIVTHPSSPTRIAPQMRGVTGWLASFDGVVARWAADTDPGVLFEGDLSGASTEVGTIVVERLLDAASEHRLEFDPFRRRHLFSTLRHRDLATQLRPWIKDHAKPFEGRYLAMDIAAAAGAADLADDLVAAVLDDANHVRLRAKAATALRQLPRVPEFDKVVAAVDVGSDESDELRAAVLELTWPDAFQFPFKVLTRPKRKNLTGLYALFLSRTFPSRLRQDMLVDALNWVRNAGYNHDEHWSVAAAHDHVLSQAWERTGEPTVLAGLVDLVRDRLRRHASPYARRRFDDAAEFSLPGDAARRAVATALITDGATKRDVLRSVQGMLLLPSDLAWALHQCEKAPDQPQAEAWGSICKWLFWASSGSVEAHEMVVAACDRSKVVDTQLGSLFKATELGSAEADEAKQEWQRHQELLAERVRDKEEPVSTEELLNRSASDVRWWWHIAHRLYVGAGHSAISVDKYDAPMKQRLVGVALAYLRSEKDGHDAWIATNSSPWAAHAGVLALEVLYRLAPEQLKTLTKEQWINWSGAIVVATNSAEHIPGVLKMAYAASPDKLLSIFRKRIVAAGAWDGSYVADEFAAIWDDRFEAVALDLLATDVVANGIIGSLVRVMLEHGADEVTEAAFRAVARARTANATERTRIIAGRLLKRRAAAFWARRQEIGDEAFLADVFLRAHLAYESAAAVASQLRGDAAAELYLWLVDRFPPGEDPDIEGGHAVGEREAVGDFRDGILRWLTNAGTDEALAALGRIRAALPGNPMYLRLYYEAEVRTLVDSWEPVTLEVLRRLLTNHRFRRVDSSAQLLDLLIELLDEYEADLRGVPPLVRTLWNNPDDDAKRSHKDEKDFSDSLAYFLKYRLRDRAVLVNREVEIRRKTGADTGQLPDLLVAIPGGETPPTVLVEAKGDWNPGVLTALKDQLVDRYMTHPFTHGIYVVGFFDDGKPKTSSDQRLTKLRATLTQEAEASSDQRRAVRSRVVDCRLRLTSSVTGS